MGWIEKGYLSTGFKDGRSGLGRECSESRGESMGYVNMGRSGDEGLCVGGSGWAFGSFIPMLFHVYFSLISGIFSP